MRTLLRIIVAAAFCISACRSARPERAADSLSMVSRRDWSALEPRPYKRHVPVRITIHHEGTKMELTDDAARKIRNIQAWGMGPDRNWADIPYHFLISRTGIIYEGRDVFTVGETATEYDPTGHLLITCLGNLEQQEVTPEQLDALVKLVAYTTKKYNLPLDSLASHRDHSTKTSCPGKNLYPYVRDGIIVQRARQLLNSSR